MSAAHILALRWFGACVWLATSLAASAVILTACSGQGTEQGCGPTAACGGDPQGLWSATGSCQYLAVSPYKSQALVPQMTMPQTPSLAKPPPSTVTSGNWCSDLVYLPPDAVSARGHITSVNLFNPPGVFTLAQLNLKSDHTYQITFEFDSKGSTHFTPECMQAYGANPTCDDLVTQMTMVIDPYYHNLVCTPASDQGCDCTYTLENLSADLGSWSIVGNVLYESSATGQQPYPIDYCVSGSGPSARLTITGHNGWNLNNVSGLRTLQMQPQTPSPADGG